MSRRISRDPKILPIIFDTWPPIFWLCGGFCAAELGLEGEWVVGVQCEMGEVGL